MDKRVVVVVYTQSALTKAKMETSARLLERDMNGECAGAGAGAVSVGGWVR